MIMFAPNVINTTAPSAMNLAVEGWSDKRLVFNHGDSQPIGEPAAEKFGYTSETSKNTTLGGAIQFVAFGIGAVIAGGQMGSMVRSQIKEDLIQFVSLDSKNLTSIVPNFHSTALTAKKYADLYAAITYMASLTEGEDMYIDEETSHAANQVLELIDGLRINPPRIFSSGEDAAVLCWDLQGATLFLTISEGVASLMINADDSGANSLGNADIQNRAEMGTLLLRLHKLIG